MVLALGPETTTPLSSVLTSLFGLPALPVMKVLSSECPGVVAEAGQLGDSGSPQHGCARAPGLRIPRPHPACVSSVWWMAQHPHLAACGAGRSRCSSSLSSGSVTSGSGVGAIWARSFQWRVRDSQVAEKPLRAHCHLQEAGTLVGGVPGWTPVQVSGWPLGVGLGLPSGLFG